MDALWQDIRFGVRMLARIPGYTIVVVLTLALGVGVNTAFFSVANFAVLRPLPVKDPGQLVVLASREKGSSELNDVSYPDFLDYREHAGAFSDMLAYRLGFDVLAADNRADDVVTSYVTGNYFSMLGITPAIGRLIEPQEGWVPGADPVVVLGYSYWLRRFGGDPAIVGKSALLNGRPVTIVGVAQKQFPGIYYFLEMDVYVPLSQSAPSKDSFWTSRGQRGEANLFVLARLRPDANLKQGRASLEVVAGHLAQQYPETNGRVSIEAYPERLARPQAGAANFLPLLVPLFLLLALVVLLMACINVANLALARANDRASEMALRAALGAGRLRLLRQLLTECLLLAVMGGGAGILLAKWLGNMLEAIATPVDVPMFRMKFVFDWRVFAYAAAITIIAGFVVALIPARRVWRSDLNLMLHEGSRAITGGRRRNRKRNALVVVQVAGSMILLIVAGLFVHMLVKTQHMDLGYDTNNILNLSVNVERAGYDEAQGKKLYADLMARVSALPGVESATYAYSVPFGSSGTLVASVFIENRQLLPGQSPPGIYYNIVGPAYFKTLGVTILRGRPFTDSDSAAAPRVAIISQDMASHFWPGEDPIGKRFRMDKPTGASLEVVGVARDAKYVNPVPWAIPYFYVPLAQDYSAHLALQIRTLLPPQTLARAVDQQLHLLDPALTVSDVLTMDQQIRGVNGLYLLNLGADAAGGLGILALLLAVVGIYGVVSYAASQRTHEIGIRLALGAQPSDILRMVLKQGLLLVAIGASVGIAAALVVSHAVSHFLLGVGPSDPLTFVGVSLLLGGAALLACYIPARRAMRTDPIVALRRE